ncbi:hypothetical protein [Neptuniibacter sp. QD37_11]|uniref:hypothetical protein n=1 Tax=Neptuniibacter sp. QD37_11 TaxID=3398209 RepID=UPI0039F5E7A5
MPNFFNEYECPRCDTTWEQEADSMCDDKCPNCNLAVQAHASEEIEEVEDEQA